MTPLKDESLDPINLFEIYYDFSSEKTRIVSANWPLAQIVGKKIKQAQDSLHQLIESFVFLRPRLKLKCANEMSYLYKKKSSLAINADSWLCFDWRQSGPLASR